MKKLAYSTFIAALLGVAAFSIAGAQGQEGQPGQRGPGFRSGFGGRGPLALGRIADLTDAQRAQVREILGKAREENTEPAAAGLHRQLETELLAEAPDDQKIETLRQQLAQAHADQLARRIEVQKQIVAVLTPEQRAKLRETLASAPARGGRRGGPDGARSGGWFR
jgi:protein CpxP